MTLTVGSLFSGIGGLDLGLERAGMAVRWQVEIDPHCQRKLTQHFPYVRRYTDVKELDPCDLEPVDLVCGGFPCQDISVAGRRAGLAGARSGLWWEFHRVVAALHPRWIVIENVPGLLSSNEGRDMGAILGALGQLGYGWAYRVLDAQHFRLAQRRRRVFIVGCAGDRRAPATVLLEPEGGAGDPPTRGAAGTRVASTLTGGSPATRGTSPAGRRAEDDVNLVVGTTMLSSDPIYTEGDGPAMPLTGRNGDSGVVITGGAQQDQFVTPDGIAPTLAHASNTHGGHHQPMVVGALMAGSPTSYRTGPDEATAGAGQRRHDELPCGSPDDNQAQAGHLLAFSSSGAGYYRDGLGTLTEGGWRDSRDGLVTHALTAEGADASEDGTGRGTPLVAYRKATKAHDGEDDPERWEQDDLSATLDAAGHGPRTAQAIVEATAVRRLTPVECERLQGFPDHWTAGQSDSTRYRQLGNAVPVPVATWIGWRIVAVAHDTAEELPA